MGYNENNFEVLPDLRTIIGVNNSSWTSLYMEDITSNTNTSISFGSHSNYIYSVLYFEEFDILLVSNLDTTLTQYQRDSPASNWKVVNSYGNLSIGSICSSARIGHFAIFGGSNYCVRVVDVVKRQILGSVFKTAISTIHTLQPCLTSRLLLFVGGTGPNYSGTTSDIVDLTAFMNPYGLTPEVDSRYTIMEDLVKSLSNQIEDLKRQVGLTEGRKEGGEKTKKRKRIEGFEGRDRGIDSRN